MNENILDLLIFLFHNFPNTAMTDTGALRHDLDQAGFPPEDVDGALAWLNDTGTGQESFASRPSDCSTRLFSTRELLLLSPECRGCLQKLQYHGILTGMTREIVIDRLLSLAETDDVRIIEAGQAEWITMMVLSKRGEKTAHARMHSMLQNGPGRHIH